MPNHTTNIMRIDGDAEDIAMLLALFEIDDPNNASGDVATDENTGKHYYFDFNKITPMPASLHLEEGSQSTWGMEIFKFPDRLIGRENDWVAMREAKLSALLLLHGVTTYCQLAQLVLGELKPDWWLGAAEAERNRLTAIVQTGQTCIRNIEEHGHPTWYGWSNHHWGTKWNSYGNEIRHVEPSSLTFEYLTAWSPPTPVLTKLFAMFPSLSFTIDYIDEGYCYAGTMTSDDGDLVDDPALDVSAFASEKFGWDFDDDDDEAHDANSTVNADQV